MDMDGDEEERRIQARFITKLKPPYKVPNTSIAIPANVTRYGLSTIVNSLLNAGDDEWESQPFDFVIDGELVRLPLEQFVLAKGISAEKVLEIENMRAAAPQKEYEPSLHDGWVSAVDGSCPRSCSDLWFPAGSSSLAAKIVFGRIWKAAGECTHILEGLRDAITSVTVVNPEGADCVTVATASKDQSLRLWKEFDKI